MGPGPPPPNLIIPTPAAPESLPTCVLPHFGHPVALPPFLSPLKSTSSQAPHPSSPRQLYQSQLRVCAELFLIAGAWFTLAHPAPPILIPLFGESLTSGTWMGAKTAFSQGLGQGPGQGPAPIPRFHGGAQKGQLMGQGHMTSVLRGWTHLTFWGSL